MSIYPTLCELATLEPPGHLEGKSIVPLLENPKSNWDGVALTTHGYLNHAIRDERYRYIRYADGSEELYDHKHDTYEFTNLAGSPGMAGIKEKLAAHLPKENKQPTKANNKK